MRLWPKKLQPVAELPDHRTEDLLQRMDVFIKDIQTIADEIKDRLDKEVGDDRT